MGWPTYDEQISSVTIPVDVLSLVPQKLMEHSFLMPLKFDKNTGCLTVVTSKYIDAFADITSILKVISGHSPNVKDINLLSVSYENFSAGYSSHFKQQFIPTVTGIGGEHVVEVDESKVTSEQTKLADNILRMGIDMNASDIHITPLKDGPAKVEFRIDGKLRDSGVMLSREDVVTVSNIYKRNAGLEVNNLIGQDGRFTFLGRDFRLSTQPYGGDNVRNKIVLRIIGYSNNVVALENLSFKKEEIAQLKEIIHKPNGIMLVCGPTGEGKSTTLYSCLQELVDTTDSVIVTVEDPIEKYINGIGQTQVRIAESERNSLTFSKALRSMLRQDPNIIMVGEIRDSETALVAVQASQTGHLILSTLHVRNSISVFRRLGDMGANISGFAEQIVGITSQRLLSLNCPHCRKRVVSELNSRLRKKDLDLLEWGVDDEGHEGYITYESKGCDKCGHTGFIGRVPLIEIIEFDNYLRDYFAEAHGLIDIEKYLRKNLGFRSLWDKGMERVADGSLSLDELIGTIEPDVDIDLNDNSIPDHMNVVHQTAPVQRIEVVEPVVVESEDSAEKAEAVEAVPEVKPKETYEAELEVKPEVSEVKDVVQEREAVVEQVAADMLKPEAEPMKNPFIEDEPAKPVVKESEDVIRKEIEDNVKDEISEEPLASYEAVQQTERVLEDIPQGKIPQDIQKGSQQENGLVGTKENPEKDILEKISAESRDVISNNTSFLNGNFQKKTEPSEGRSAGIHMGSPLKFEKVASSNVEKIEEKKTAPEHYGLQGIMNKQDNVSSPEKTEQSIVQDKSDLTNSVETISPAAFGIVRSDKKAGED